VPTKYVRATFEICLPFSPIDTCFRLAAFKAGVEKDEPSPIKYVFHGTDPQNMDSIMRTGMDPKLRRHEGDYFTTDPRIALAYSRQPYFGQRIVKLQHDKVLVFLVIALKPGLLRMLRGDKYVAMDKVEYELPIFEVTIGQRK
jgi:hypothetical protein